MVPLEGTMTMMSCIDWALESAGYPTIGADKGYISEINGVAEKRNGEYSGWMGHTERLVHELRLRPVHYRGRNASGRG